MIDGGNTAHGGRRCACDRDPDLRGRQEPLRVFLKTMDETGTGVPFFDQLLDPAAPRVDDGQLGTGKKAVQKNQYRNRNDLKPHNRAFLAVRWSGPSGPASELKARLLYTNCTSSTPLQAEVAAFLEESVKRPITCPYKTMKKHDIALTGADGVDTVRRCL